MFRILTALLFSMTLASSASRSRRPSTAPLKARSKTSQGALLPGVTSTVTSLDTGDTRVVVTNERGSTVRRCCARHLQGDGGAAGFKGYERTGITIRAGQTAVIDVGLTVGAVSETITVTADSPIRGPGQDRAGRTLTGRESRRSPSPRATPITSRCCSRAWWASRPTKFGGCPASRQTARCCA